MQSFPMSVVSAMVLIGLSACSKPTVSKTTAAAGPPAVSAAPSDLWSIEVLDGDKVTSRVDICADQALRTSFARPTPELGGKSCAPVSDAVQTDAIYSVKCRMDERLYRVGAIKSGDEARDFVVNMSVKRQDLKGPIFEQSRRYRLIGACPKGWTIGDSAAPGAKQVVNTLTGATRPAAPAG